MNRTRMIVGLVLAMTVALLFSTYVYRTFKRMTVVKPAVTGHLVVAYRPMQLGTRVDSNNLRLIDWPADEPVPGMFQRIEDCAGRALITPVAQTNRSWKASWHRKKLERACRQRFRRECEDSRLR